MQTGLPFVALREIVKEMLRNKAPWARGLFWFCVFSTLTVTSAFLAISPIFFVAVSILSLTQIAMHSYKHFKLSSQRVDRRHRIAESLHRANRFKAAVEKNDLTDITLLTQFPHGITKKTIHPQHLRKSTIVHAAELALEQAQYALFEALLSYDEKIPNRVLKQSLQLQCPSEHERLVHVLSKYCFAKYLSLVPSMIFIYTRPEENAKIVQNKKITVVFNNNGYLKNTIKTNEFLQKGQSLILGRTLKTPIGYNFFLPAEGEISHVLVEVYAGLQSYQREKEAYAPFANRLGNSSLYLLNHGTAIVQLNLPDLLKLNRFQLEMEESLHQEIHACIHRFYRMIKQSPERLHPLLAKLKDKKIFLMGASFGGRTAIRHAQMYPHTFDGYISENGAISLAVDNEYNGDEAKYNPTLDPGIKRRVERITQPILLLQSRDDNNVNVRVTLDFYAKLSVEQKQQLARMHIYTSGSPIEKKDKFKKGHSINPKETLFENYMQTILAFINEGPEGLPVFNENTFLIENTLANRFNHYATLLERFCGYAYDLSLRVRDDGRKIIQEWEKYKLLLQVLSYVDDLLRDSQRLEIEINRLKQDNLLTDEMIAKTLQQQGALFTQFIKEYYKFKWPREFSINKVWVSPETIAIFRKKIESLNKEKKAEQHYLLFTLYLENPALLQACLKEESTLQTQAKTALCNVVNASHACSFVWTYERMSMIPLQPSMEKSIIKLDNSSTRPAPE